MQPRFLLLALLIFAGAPFAADLAAAKPEKPASRKPADEAELRYWLQNMVWHHRFTSSEVAEATGLSAEDVEAALKKFDIRPDNRPKRPADAPLLVLPYPGGRHPRIGFQDGALRPQRETKVSVFCPWDVDSYVVVDVPEAIWSNLGLTYLAHTHVPTIWDKLGVDLEPLEWNRRADGSLGIKRKLPNGIEFAAEVMAAANEVRFEMTLTNGTAGKLSDLRVQMCAMLKGVAGFAQQNNDNKVFAAPYAACRSADGKQWIIMAWEPNHHTWGNAPCPCLHSDPKFPDCAPGETVKATGRLWFYRGADVQAEFRRLDATGWRTMTQVRGEVVDAADGSPLACRLYIRGENGTWWFPRSEAAGGSAVYYKKSRPERAGSVEMHTTLSAHPFLIDLPPGKYTVVAERGKEFLTETQDLVVGERPTDFKVKLRRWIDMPRLGWYSGDTHVHRTIEEMPNLLQAEDLNVAFPLTYWVTRSDVVPHSDKTYEPKPVAIDATHVYYPLNTEYEIFSVGAKQHMLGAVFVLGHRTPPANGVPPVGPVARRARAEGALLELDKHNWPWSMMIAPVMPVDLFELANNHVWRAEFAFGNWAEQPVEYMKVERDARGWTERGWLDFGFTTYYALLDCGIRMRPTAGTGSGVHPVPLGWGRVYVHLPEGFSYDAWLRGLNEGRSFVSTGPMLMIQVDGKEPGHVFAQPEAKPKAYRVTGEAASAVPLSHIEIIVNGEVARTIKPENRAGETGGYRSVVDETIDVAETSWIAVRCFEDRPDKRVRFAHTAPVHIDVAGAPIRPRRVEAEYLVHQVETQLKRNEGVIPDESLAEYREALKIYRQALERAR